MRKYVCDSYVVAFAASVGDLDSERVSVK